MKPQALLSWSSGKDCAWTLYLLRQQSAVEVVGLVTTYNEAFNRVAMHGVRMELVEEPRRPPPEYRFGQSPSPGPARMRFTNSG